LNDRLFGSIRREIDDQQRLPMIVMRFANPGLRLRGLMHG
jgi:hypothetical protein